MTFAIPYSMDQPRRLPMSKTTKAKSDTSSAKVRQKAALNTPSALGE